MLILPNMILGFHFQNHIADFYWSIMAVDPILTQLIFLGIRNRQPMFRFFLASEGMLQRIAWNGIKNWWSYAAPFQTYCQ